MIRMNVDFLRKATQGKELKLSERKKSQSKILYPWRMPFKKECEVKMLTSKNWVFVTQFVENCPANNSKGYLICWI